jgi:hypothetical protein
MHRRLLIAALTVYALGVYGYMSLRFAGYWNEGDTAYLTRVLYTSEQANSVLQAERTYDNGMAYAAVSLFLAELGGVSIQALQYVFYPLLSALLPVVLFVALRALTQHGTIALLSTLLIYVQPDFLWVTWRGSHEKLTWALTLTLLFLLTRSLVVRDQFSRLARYMALFYMMAFALVTSNTFFASSFTAMLALGFFLGLVILRARSRIADEDSRLHLRRMLYLSLSLTVLLYVFVFFIYPPALGSLRALQSLIDSLAALFLDVEVGANAYDYVAATWTHSQLYLLLTAFNWSILGVSAIVWLVGVYRFVRGEIDSQRNLPRLFLWLIYPTFTAQLAASVIADRSAVLGANLQVRLFTPVMLTAIPIAVIGLYEAAGRIRFARMQVALAVCAAALIGWFSIAALLKATNEPLINNRWIFSTSPERAAGEWMLTQTENALIWSGLDERFEAAMTALYPNLRAGRVRFYGAPEPREGTRYYVLTGIEQIRWARQRRELPFLGEENLIYDNGAAWVYDRRPRTPYQ